MHSNPLSGNIAGFALTEAMVSLLLLALALLGAASALVGSLAGQRAALLQTRAADLASNLAETLRAASDAATASTEIAAWRSAIMLQLPEVQAAAVARNPSPSDTPPSLLPARFDIRLQWRNPQQQGPVQLVLPLGFNATDAAR